MTRPSSSCFTLIGSEVILSRPGNPHHRRGLSGSQCSIVSVTLTTTTSAASLPRRGDNYPRYGVRLLADGFVLGMRERERERILLS